MFLDVFRFFFLEIFFSIFGKFVGSFVELLNVVFCFFIVWAGIVVGRDFVFLCGMGVFG